MDNTKFAFFTKKNYKIHVIAKKVHFLCFVLFFNVVLAKEQGHDVSSPLAIVATTGMIGDAVKNIVKDKAEVTTLMGPGVDPHLYKATQKDLKKIMKADLVFYNGLYLEGKMAEIFKKLQKIKPLYAVSDVLDKKLLLHDPDYHNNMDPHIWFDITLWIAVVKYINYVIGKKDPTNTTFYQKNTTNYINQLKELHDKIKKKIKKIPSEQRILITAHDAFSYFGRAYGLEVKSLQGISTLSEFGVRDITNLVNFIVTKKIKALFLETATPDKPMKAVLEGCLKKRHTLTIGGALYADAMGKEGTLEGTYIGMFTKNVSTIVQALQ